VTQPGKKQSVLAAVPRAGNRCALAGCAVCGISCSIYGQQEGGLARDVRSTPGQRGFPI
jgi:hypothetical protein